MTYRQEQERKAWAAHAAKQRDEELRRQLISELKMQRINFAIVCERIDKMLRERRMEELRKEVADKIAIDRARALARIAVAGKTGTGAQNQGEGRGRSAPHEAAKMIDDEEISQLVDKFGPDVAGRYLARIGDDGVIRCTMTPKTPPATYPSDPKALRDQIISEVAAQIVDEIS